VNGLKLSRAYDYLRIAGGRTTDEELRKDARERQKKSREKKKKIPGPIPAPKKPDFRDVTESKERKPEKVPAWIDAAQQSSRALAEFTFACKTYLPRITVADDIDKAVQLVLDMTSSKPKSEAA
jgi:hypothetical protein